MATPDLDVRTGDTIIGLLQKDLEKEKLELPILSDTVTAVLSEISANDVDAEKVAQLLSEAPLLSARLLRLCNSSLFSADQPFEGLSAAISVLGYSTIRTLVVCLSLESLFHDDDYRVDTVLQGIWQHCCEVAALSAVLGAQTPGLEKGNALLAGLAHDIGKVAILKHTRTNGKVFSTADAIEYGMQNMHHQVGEAILSRWGLPVGVIEAAIKHDNLNYQHSGPPSYTDVVIVANLQSVCETSHHYSDVEWSNVPAFECLGVPTNIYFADIEANADIISEIEALLLDENDDDEDEIEDDTDGAIEQGNPDQEHGASGAV